MWELESLLSRPTYTGKETKPILGKYSCSHFRNKRFMLNEMTTRYYCYDLMSLWIIILFIKSRYWYGSSVIVSSEILVVCLSTCGQPLRYCSNKKNSLQELPCSHNKIWVKKNWFSKTNLAKPWTSQGSDPSLPGK